MRIDFERLQTYSAEPLTTLEEHMENMVRQEREVRRQIIEERKARKRKRKKRRQQQHS